MKFSPGRGAPVAEQPRLDVLARAAARAAAGCRAGRSGRPTGSWRPASRRRCSPAAPRPSRSHALRTARAMTTSCRACTAASDGGVGSGDVDRRCRPRSLRVDVHAQGARRKAAAARTPAEPSPTPPLKTTASRLRARAAPGHRPGQPAVVDREREGGLRVAAARRGPHLRMSATPARPLRPLSRLSRRSTSCGGDAPPDTRWSGIRGRASRCGWPSPGRRAGRSPWWCRRPPAGHGRGGGPAAEVAPPRAARRRAGRAARRP